MKSSLLSKPDHVLNKLLLLLLLIFCFVPLFDTPVFAQLYLNLDFETVNPVGMIKCWMYQGDVNEVRTDSIVKYSGRYSLCISRNLQAGFRPVVSTFPIEAARGKRLVFSGYIKTENVTGGYAGLWWRVDTPQGVGAFDNMDKRGPSGTTDWKKFTIELSLDSNAKNINFGVMLVGSGRAWFDKLEITLDGQPYLQEEPAIFQPDEKQLNWLRNNCVKISTEDPSSSKPDLSGIEDIVGNAKIVALGEGTHGTSEFFKMKHRIVKYLAEHMGFTIFAIEANLPEAKKVNDYVLYGKGNPKEALAGMYFWTWNTQEVLEMIEWMRSFNQSGKGRIEFWGFDMQTPTVAMEIVRKFAASSDRNYLDSINLAYNDIDSLISGHNNLKNWRNDLFCRLRSVNAKSVLEHLITKRNQYLSKNTTEQIDWIIQNAEIVFQSMAEYTNNGPSRDESMAKNIEWILSHSKPGSKIVLWAHNAHVSKNISGYKPMGSCLNKIYGKDLIVFGFGFHEGRYTAIGKSGLGTYTTSSSAPGSFEWAFHKTGIPQFIIDLRKAAESSGESAWIKRELDFRSIGAVAMDYAFSPMTISNEFDALIFFDHSSPSVLLNDKRLQ